MCNLKCSFCNIIRNKDKFVLSEEEGLRLVRELGENGCFYLSFAGGEPLLVKHVFNLIHAAKDSGINYVHLVTNGDLISKEIAYKLYTSGLDEISISIDGDEEYHDKMRLKKGVFYKALSAIETITKLTKIKVVVNTIFSPFEPEQCLYVLGLAQKHKWKMKVQPLNQHRVFNDNDNATIAPFLFSNSQKEKIKSAVKELKRANVVVNSKPFLNNIERHFLKNDKLMLSGKKCIFGYHHIEVMENGYFSPCLEGTNWEKLFRLKDGIFNQINSKEYRTLLQKLKTCNMCEKNFYVCYYEPRLNFPLWNLLKYRL